MPVQIVPGQYIERLPRQPDQLGRLPQLGRDCLSPEPVAVISAQLANQLELHLLHPLGISQAESVRVEDEQLGGEAELDKVNGAAKPGVDVKEKYRT